MGPDAGPHRRRSTLPDSVAKRRKRRLFGKHPSKGESSDPPVPDALPDEPPLDDVPTPSRRRRRKRSASWRMFPYRGRFLSPETRYVYERLPGPPATFSAPDIAVLCVEADRALELDVPCNPAEVIDLLTSRGLVQWTDEGFVRHERPQAPPRA